MKPFLCILGVLLLIGATAPRPRLKLHLRHKPKLESPKGAEAARSLAVRPLLVQVPPSRNYSLVWQYPQPVPVNISFKVWAGSDPLSVTNFLGQTTNLSFVIFPTNASGFFRVSAVNTNL